MCLPQKYLLLRSYVSAKNSFAYTDRMYQKKYLPVKLHVSEKNNNTLLVP